MKTITFNFKRLVSVLTAVLIFTLTIVTYFNTDVSAVNTAQSYTVFRASDGAYRFSYSLSANSVTDNSRAQIGDYDERVVTTELSGIVRIMIDEDYVTGFVVDAHTIATAAHCVFDRGHGDYTNKGLNTGNIMIYDENGAFVMTATPYDIHVPNSYISYVDETIDDDGCEAYDYAMITVNEDLSDYACFNLGVPLDGMIGSDTPVYCIGFPNGEEYNGGKYKGEGRIVADGGSADASRILCHTVDATSGNSGSPIYTVTEYGEGVYYYTVIGIHTHGIKSQSGNFRKNGATQMTTDLLHFYKNNPNIYWEE